MALTFRYSDICINSDSNLRVCNFLHFSYYNSVILCTMNINDAPDIPRIAKLQLYIGFDGWTLHYTSNCTTVSI